MENNELKLKIDKIKQHNNLKKLRIYGLPKDTTVPLNTQITQLIERKLELKDISPVQCYRLGSSITGDSRSSESRNRNSAVIAIFDSLQQRNTVFYNKKKLKESKIAIVKELTKSRQHLLNLAKEKIGKNLVWTMGGNIFTKHKNRRLWLKNENDVANMDG